MMYSIMKEMKTQNISQIGNRFILARIKIIRDNEVKRS